MLFENHLSLLSHYPLFIIFIGAILGSESIVIFATLICHKNGISINLVVVITICGAIIGNQLWFSIGNNFGSKFLNKHVCIKKDTLKFRKWVDEKSALMALGSRFIYGVGSIAPLLLGVNHYSQLKYLLFNILGAILWGLLIVKFGFMFGNKFVAYLENSNCLEYILVIAIILILIRWWHKHKGFSHHIFKIAN